jgi:hypothetical protein
MNAAYIPQAGSIAARALAHLQTLPDGVEIRSGPLAEALGITSNIVNVSLVTATRHGIFVREKRHDRIFWKLGPNVPLAGPPPAAAPPPEPANAADLEDAPDDDAAPIARIVPSDAVTPIPGLLQQSWCPAAQNADPQSSRGEPAPPPPSPAAPKPTGLAWRAPRVPVFERDASAANTAPAAAPEPGSAEAAVPPADDPHFLEVMPAPAAAPMTIELAEFVRAARVARLQDELAAEREPVDGFRCALWSNGMLEIRTTEGETHLLNEDDTRGLLRYVGDVLSARTRAAA